VRATRTSGTIGIERDMQKQSGLAETPFWRRKRLADMTPAEWESLCDGCGLCCLHKIMDEDSNDIAVTDVACRLLDLDTCRCSDYPNRRRHVPDCVHLTPETTANLNWLPSTCAYRLVDQGRDLFDWHPLVSGDPETVHRAGISARGAAVSEDDVDDLEDHVQAWLDAGADPFTARKKRKRR
jgi:uncharacterized cysteine cluster protein YcgN (CxxCxxCC family)